MMTDRAQIFVFKSGMKFQNPAYSLLLTFIFQALILRSLLVLFKLGELEDKRITTRG